MKYSILLLTFFFTSLFGKADVSGDWCAILDMKIMKLTLNLRINEDETATFESVEQRVLLPIDAITYDGSSFSFTIPEYKISYTGAVQDEEIKGTFTQGQTFPLNWKRGQGQPLKNEEKGCSHCYNPKPQGTYSWYGTLS